MNNAQAITEVRAILNRRYANYNQLPNPERVLLAAAVLADDIQVREVGGNNKGEWVEAILEGVKLGEGYPWCAAFIEFCCDVAGFTAGPTDRASAAVDSWLTWARMEGRVTSNPKRGDLCLWKRSTGNHIGIVTDLTITSIMSIEGNTTPGATGNQRDGGGCYRRTRLRNSWTHFISLG